ncbi:putative large repetitive protein [Blattamonas nauphoetae]|uniref:Large repetitive protein n=1 Tax=Blattamonas nauphoetae TaxID=2049346 RepID=A0ABQ9Y772_9EUKA|nr:putative large repetitive protein [Blattamonas nauphoetae]
MTHDGFDSTGEHLIVRVRGRQMPVGTYTIKLNPGDLSLDFVFGAVKDGETFAERDSEPLSIPIFGENTKILFDTEYSITDASEKLSDTSIFVSKSEIVLTTPSEPARITAITDETYDSLFTQLTLSFSGINCVAAGHTMTVKNTATQKTHTFNVIFDTPQTGSRTEYIYNTGGTTNLTFGATYEVIGVTASTGQIFFTSGMTFTVVPARHRLLSTGTTTVDDDVTVVSIRMKGDNMPIGNTTLQLLDSTHYTETSESLYVNVEVSFSTESEGLLEITIYPTPQLVYGHSYLAWSMNRTEIDEKMFVTTHFTIQMPTEPSRLAKIAQFEHLDDDKAIRLSWEGRVMKNGPYTATLSVNGTSTTTLTLTFNAGGTTSTSTETLFRNPLSVLKYNTKYVVTEVTDSSDTPVIVHTGITFTTNAEPTRLLSVFPLEHGADLNTTTLTLSGHQLPAGSATLTVVPSSVASGEETESDKINLPVSITQSGDDSTGTVSISLYPTPTLVYGKTYRIVSLSSAKYIDATLTFKMPDEPSRLERITNFEHLDCEKEIELSWEGRLMTNGPYTATLSVNGTSTTTLTLTFNAGGTTSTTTETLFKSSLNGLKYNTKYVVTGLTDSSNEDVIVNSGITFTTNPEPTRLLSLSGPVDADGMNTTVLTLAGHQLPAGDATLTVVPSSVPSGSETEANTINLTVSFTESGDDSTGTVSISLYPTPTLAYRETYRIVFLSSAKYIDATLTFKMPDEPSRLERITNFEHLDCEKEIELSWEGRLMTNGPYTATLSVNGTSTTTLTLTFNAGGTTSTTTETLFKSSLNGLKYNTKYVVTGLTDSSNEDVIVNSGITFTTNPEPTRLLSLSGPVDADGMNTTVLTLAGHQLPAGDATLTVVPSSVPSGSETEANTINLTVSFTESGDDSTGTVSISLYPTPTLAYGQTYRIVFLSSAKYIDTTLTFKMPDEPSRLERITNFEHLDCEKEIELSWEGRLMTNGPYTATLSVNGTSTTTLTLTFNAGGTTSTATETLFKSSLNGLKYNTKYVVTGLTDSSNEDVIVNSGITFTTNPEPTRLLSLSGPVDADGMNTTVLTLAGHQLPAGDATLTVVPSSVPSGSETEANTINLTVSFTESGDDSTGTVSISLYPTPTLAYGQTYRIVFLSSAKYIDTTLTFKMPDEPSRLERITNFEHLDCEKEIELSWEGRLMTNGPYTATLSVNGTSTTTLTLTFNAGGTTSTATETLFKSSLNGLKYNTKYVVTGLTDSSNEDVIVNSGITFTTNPEPTRLLSLSGPVDADGMNTTVLTLAGHQLPAGDATLTVVPSSVPSGSETEANTINLTVSFTESGDDSTGTVSISLYPTPTLAYGQTYRIVFLSSAKYIDTTLTFKMPDEPSRLERITNFEHLDCEKEIELSWEGRLMTNGPYTATLSVNGTSTTTLTLTFNAGGTTSTATETLFKSSLNGLKYNTKYVVTGLTDSSNEDVIVNSGITFTTNPEPTRLLSLSGPVDADGMNTTVLTLAGHQLPAGDATLTVVPSSVPSGSETEANTINLTVSFTESGDDSTGTVSISLYPTPTLAYGQTYRIVFLSSAKYIDTTLTFKMPDEPSRLERITNFEHLDCEKEIELSWEGRLMTNGPYTATLSVNGTSTTTLTLTFNAGGTTSTATETLFKSSLNGLKYNTKYVVTGLTDSSNEDVIVNSGITFTTNPEPTRLLSLSGPVDADGMNTTVLTLAGHQLPAGDATLTVVPSSVPSGSETEANTINLTVSFTESGDDSTGTVSISLYPTPTLAYRETYRIVSLSSADYIDATLTFKMPDEPSRLEKVTPVLSEDAKQVTLTFEGRVFASGVYELTLQPAASNTAFIVTLDHDGDGTLSCSISTDDLVTPHVILGQVYTIEQITKNSNPIVINPKAKQFTAPIAALLKSISFEFTNSPCTSYKLVLTAENVTVNQNYILTLTTGETFSVKFSTPEKGGTASHPIGWDDTLLYGTEYTVAGLREESSEAPIRKQADKFTTKPKPPTITLFVDLSSASDDLMCGDQANPCTSIVKAWDIAVGLEHDEITIRILKETKETESFVISKDMSVLIENGKNLNPIIRIPASTTLSGDSGLITVSEGSLELKKVEVAVETISESFVFLSAVNSTITLKECVIDGMNIPPPNSNSLSVCEWTSGVVQLDNCETTIDWTKFHELPQGALNMKSGRITIDDSIFRDNTPNHDLFPSARRNILCSDEGEVRIGKLRSGDGTEDGLSPWMALDDCHLNSTSVDAKKALFIPTLDSSKTKSKHTSKSYDVSIVGSVLMPCGLGLEVVEWDERAKVEKRSTTIELAGLNSSEWTDTSVNFTLNLSSIKDVDHTQEIRARLSFGHNQSTSNHMVLKISDATEKKALTLEQTKKALVWLIPVIVAVVAFFLILTIVLLCRRKRQQKDDRENLLKNRELDQHEPIDVEKIEEQLGTIVQIREPHTNNMLHHNLPTTIGSSVLPAKDTLKQVDNQYSERRVQTETKTKMAVRCEEELVEVPVNVNSTLYNRLHKGGPPLDSPRVFRMITQGLAQIAKHNPKMPILTRLSPLWVFLDEQDTPVFQMKEESVSVPQNIPESSFFPGSEHNRTNQNIVQQQEEPLPQTLTTANASFFSQSMTANTSVRHIEGQRWMAPEVANKKVEIDTSKAAVFSLGLILWEMETGLVPFGEIDSANAQRQLGTGSLPLMDSWTNQSKIELVRSCLSLDPKERPTLDEILSLLDSDAELGKPAMDKQNMEEC